MPKVDCVQVKITENQDQELITTENFKLLYFNFKRFININALDLGNRKIDDIEILILMIKQL